MMIDKVEFKNFKILRDAVLPLGPFTLIVGPNASGKSTALEAIDAATRWSGERITSSTLNAVAANAYFHEHLSIGEDTTSAGPVCVSFHWKPNAKATISWGRNSSSVEFRDGAKAINSSLSGSIGWEAVEFRRFSFESAAIAAPTELTPTAELLPNGGQLAVVLDRLRDQHPDRFRSINEAVSQWLPEYDYILFDTPSNGMRAIRLRVRGTERGIPAISLSDGTLVILAILTLAHLPTPPSLVAIEEPDRGIHPRLFRLLQDALYRLSFPQDHGDNRNPVQVIVTTHSPYFLDLFKDHPEEIVIANKNGLEASFTRLSDQPNIQEILEDASLGGAWYTGILGGVPAGT